MRTSTLTVNRSVRMNDRVWEKARKRAESEGLGMSSLLRLLVEGYADGKINAPSIQKVYG